MSNSTSSAPVEIYVVAWADRMVEFILRRWLPLTMSALGVFVTLPFLAPVAMAVGWTGLGDTIYKLYIPFCHQLPQRSWFLFGPQLTYTLEEINQVYPHTDPWQLRFFYGTPEMGWRVAWSDRMISFYGLMPVFGVAYAVLRRVRARPLPPLPLKLFLLAFPPMAIDGGTHAINDLLFGISGSGFRDTNAWLATLTGHAYSAFYAGDHFGTFNWWMRLITGTLAAWAVVFLTLPYGDKLLREEQRNHAARQSLQRSDRPLESLIHNEETHYLEFESDAK